MASNWLLAALDSQDNHNGDSNPLAKPEKPANVAGPSRTDGSRVRAMALHDYKASPGDPTEISFKKGAVFELLDKSGNWWPVNTASGELNIVPSNYFQIIEGRARALYDYTADSQDPSEVSFKKGDIIDIFDRSGKWWSTRFAGGNLRIVPSNYLQWQ